jgi:invasion protein IalB
MKALAFGFFLGALVLASAGPHAEDRAFGSWTVECSSPDAGEKCAMTQRVATDPEGKKVVLGVIVEGAPQAAQYQVIFRLSRNAYVPAGAGMKIDDHEPKRAPISACDDKVCEVRAWLTPELLTEMRDGKLLDFAFLTAEKKQVSVPVSLAGFGAAYDALGKRLQ